MRRLEKNDFSIHVRSYSGCMMGISAIRWDNLSKAMPRAKAKPGKGKLKSQKNEPQGTSSRG